MQTTGIVSFYIFVLYIVKTSSDFTAYGTASNKVST